MTPMIRPSTTQQQMIEKRAGSNTIVSALMASCSKMDVPAGNPRGNDTWRAMDYNARLLYEGVRIQRETPDARHRG